jgi:hypothetical protein
MISNKHFLQLKKSKGWNVVIKSQIIKFSGLRYIIAFKDHDSFRTNIKADQWSQFSK